MADLNKLLAIYRDWPDGKLLEEYEKKADYSAIAIKAMDEVLKDRGLLDGIQTGGLDNLIRKEKEAALIAEKAWIQDKSKRVFNDDFLEPDSNGIYAEGILLNQTRSKLGSKGSFKLSLGDDAVHLTISHGPFEARIQSPFECLFYGTKTVKKTNFFKTSEWFTLHLMIKYGEAEWLAIQEKQRSFKRLPEGWEQLDFNDPRLQPPYIFEYINADVTLQDIKKVFDHNRK